MLVACAARAAASLLFSLFSDAAPQAPRRFRSFFLSLCIYRYSKKEPRERCCARAAAAAAATGEGPARGPARASGESESLCVGIGDEEKER